MKIKAIAMLALALLLAAHCALAQTLPGVDVFSPGLVRLSERMGEEPAVHMEAELSVEDAFYVRDLSLLRAMLEGTTLVYDGAQNGEQLSIVRGGETLLSGAMTADTLLIGGEAFALEKAQDARAQAAAAALQTLPVLERAPLAGVEAFLLGLEQGEALVGGYAVAQPFESVRTMSDDGTRLTRINITGSIAREGEAPWVIEGYLKQPAGRAPKDTFELTATQDEDNWLELSYSSLRQSEITKKNRAGQNSVDTNVKIAGEIGGYRVTTRLTVYLRNTWSADPDAQTLSEKVVLSGTLTHQDNTPGREMQRMNQLEGKMRHEIRLTTKETDNDVFDLSDAITLSLVMDDNTVFDAGADVLMSIGGGQTVSVPSTATAAEAQADADAQDAQAAIERAVQEMAKKIFAQLDDQAREKILDGLSE